MTELKQIILTSYCDGPPRPDNFALETRPLPEPKEGQFLVRHIFNSVDPGTRSRLSGGDSYAAALPLGKPVDGFSVGIVEESQHADYAAGDKVFFAGGWRTHSVQSGKGFIGKVAALDGIPLSLWIGVLGVPGLTAWFGLKETARFRKGDHVLVTSAAGPVGATAGQLARQWGAGKITGIAGSDEKCDWLIEEAGFDAALNYKTDPDLSASLKREFPEGIDVLFDNVGNASVERVMPHLRLNGRICVSGQVADYNVPLDARVGLKNTAPFITHRINMAGLVVFDFMKAFPEALQSMAMMIASGDLAYAEERFDGIDAMPEAFCGLFKGENFGRRVVQVSEET